MRPIACAQLVAAASGLVTAFLGAVGVGVSFGRPLGVCSCWFYAHSTQVTKSGRVSLGAKPLQPMHSRSLAHSRVVSLSRVAKLSIHTLQLCMVSLARKVNLPPTSAGL